MMLYVTQAWGRMADAPHWSIADPRGTRSVWLLPIHLARVGFWMAHARALDRLDLVHLNVAGRGSTLRKLTLSELASALGLPTIVHLHDNDYRKDLALRGRLVRYLVRRMFERAIMVIVLGERDRMTVQEVIGIPPRRVVTLHNAVPDPGAPPGRASRAGACRIVFLGHLDDRKGVPELLAAMASTKLRRRAWHLDLAGGGEVARFRAEVARLGLTERVTLHSWVPVARVTALCRDADLFVLPSHAEGQAMSLLEAMAHGLAIVTTPVGAHLEAVTDRVEALIVPPGDVAALGEAIARLLDDRGLRLSLGTAARARYEAGFTIDRYAARLAGLYREVLRKSAVGRTAIATRDAAS